MKKAVITAVALTLVLCLTVGGTLAWLMDKTGEVKNTFTVGDVDIELTETLPADKTAKMVPGATIGKNPTITVSADSENCYVFVKIDESANLKDFISYTVADGWTEVETGVYYRTAVANDKFAVLADNQVTVKDTVTKAMMDAVGEAKPTLTFTAYAIQSANLKVTQIADIWNLAKTAQ